MSLHGRVAIITGGGAGIGHAACHAFAAAGARVAVVDVAGERAEAAAESIRREGGHAVAVCTDVADPADVDLMAEAVADHYGRIDVLYNNAGGPLAVDGDVTELEPDDWQAALRVDLFGTIHCSRAVLPHLRADGGGSIVNTTSMVAVRGVAGRDGYVAAKGAIIALTKSMAAEFGQYGVTVNAIAPGVTRSDRVMVALREDNRTRALVDRHVVGLVEPEDIAAAAVFLGGPGARKITGQVLSVDSGATQILTSQR
jgi:NAD(P)-dependent dehydrogenase (short-subunit alcohol dehydrogenase family)